MTLGCINTSPSSTSCNTTNTEFQQIHNYLTNTLNLPTQYLTGCREKRIDFAVTANKTICKIGFHGNDSAYHMNMPYNIYIFDHLSNLIYSGSQMMSPLGEYHTLTSPLAVTPGNGYIVIVGLAATPPSSYYNSFLHFHNNGNAIPFPQSAGNTTVIASVMSVGSNCSNNGDHTLPKIDIVYQ